MRSFTALDGTEAIEGVAYELEIDRGKDKQGNRQTRLETGVLRAFESYGATRWELVTEDWTATPGDRVHNGIAYHVGERALAAVGVAPELVLSAKPA